MYLLYRNILCKSLIAKSHLFAQQAKALRVHCRRVVVAIVHNQEQTINT